MNYEEFDEVEWRRSRDGKYCICAHFGPPPECVARPPFNASCFYHGERQQR